MKKIILALLLIFLIATSGLTVSYTTVYPTGHTGDYVKATTERTADWSPEYATDPAKSLTGSTFENEWNSVSGTITNQRFHVDLGSAVIIRRIYYENAHHEGGYTTRGVNNFTFWGSNTGAGTFDDLVFGNDEGWTQLTISQSTFDEHTAADQADPKYITVTNTIAYRYYAFKIADGHGDASYMGIRHVAVQTEDGYPPTTDNSVFFGFNF